MKRLYLAALLLLAALMPTSAVMAANGGQPRDNDCNAMIYGGAYTKGELSRKLNHNPNPCRVTPSMATQDFADHRVTVSSILSSDTVDGTVMKSGEVQVNGRTVATGAQTYGRSNISGSQKVGDLYKRSTSVSFQQSELPAFVHMNNGQFQFAIIKSCGNLTVAQPVAVKQNQPAAVTVLQPKTIVVQQPAPLPQTGAEGASAVGVSVLAYAAWLYRRSRRNLAIANIKASLKA